MTRRDDARAAEEMTSSPGIRFAAAEITPDAREAVLRVLASGWVTTGPEVGLFESEFADHVGAPHAVAVSSCTAGLELSLMALDLPAGAKVLTSTMTFCGAVHAIIGAGLRPVLADIDDETLMPSPDTIRDAVRRADGIDAMMIVHLAGHPAQVEQAADAAGLPLSRVIEDAAHALGSSVGRREVGTISRATSFSFYATKNLPIGEGGMVTTSDSRLADSIRRTRLHGMSKDAWKRYLPGGSWRYAVEGPGRKANMSDVQAAIGRAHLRHLPAWQEKRTALAARYDLQLASVAGVRVPSRPSDGRHAWHLYIIRVDDTFGVTRDDLIATLAERGIECSVHFIPIHHHAYFRALLETGNDRFPVADEAFRTVLSLPLHPGLTADDVDRVCREIADVGRLARRPGRTAEGAA